jgi:branched-chain amino acid transport system substrate-binding protein
VSLACLGVSLALTGPEGVYARQLRDAIQLALDDERELSPLDVIVTDDCAEPGAAVRAAIHLADSDAVAVVGPMNSWTCEVQAPIFARAGLAQITPSASNPELTRRGWPGFFRMCPGDLEQARVLARVARDLVGGRSVAAVHDGTAFAAPLAAAFLDASSQIGLDVGPVAAVQADEPESFLHAADLVAAAQPDAVFIAGLEDPCRLAALAIRAAGTCATFLGTDAIKPTRCLVTPGVVDGPYLTNAGVDAAQRVPAFHERFEARFGPHHSIYTVETYDAVRLLAAAIRRAGAPTRAGVLEAMRSMPPYAGLDGAIAFDARGERIAPHLGVYRWDGSRMRFVGSQAPEPA